MKLLLRKRKETQMNNFSEKMFNKDEKIEMALRLLYEENGFKKFKMNR